MGGISMTLEEAIEHCEEKACGSSECALEHKQLAEWLKELQALKRNNSSIEEKFDINSLQPGSKVLVRFTSHERWKIDFFCFLDTYKMAHCSIDYYKKCIPYNDETKHLVGTKEDCPKYYKWWEE